MHRQPGLVEQPIAKFRWNSDGAGQSIILQIAESNRVDLPLRILLWQDHILLIKLALPWRGK